MRVHREPATRHNLNREVLDEPTHPSQLLAPFESRIIERLFLLSDRFKQGLDLALFLAQVQLNPDFVVARSRQLETQILNLIVERADYGRVLVLDALDGQIL